MNVKTAQIKGETLKRRYNADGTKELSKNKLYKFGAGFFPPAQDMPVQASGKAKEAQIATLSKLTTMLASLTPPLTAFASLSVLPAEAKLRGKKATLASLTPPLTAFASLSVLPAEAKLRGKKATQHDGKKTSEMYKLFFDSD
jgi:hypothetical protein